MALKLVVITVNYGVAHHIIGAMPEIVAQLRALGGAQWWIVDNCSPDDSVVKLETAITHSGVGDIVRLLPSPVNGGFGAGNNVAISEAMTLAAPPEYFFFLNPDAIPKAGAIDALLRFLDEHPQAGIAGGLLCDESGAITPSAFRFPTWRSEIDGALRLKIIKRLFGDHTMLLCVPDRPEKVDWVTGASFMARRSAIEKAGAFDEDFFLYWEETELCHRINSAGFEVFTVPEAVVVHIGGVSTDEQGTGKPIPKYWFDSRAKYFHKTGAIPNLFVLNVAVAMCLAIRRVINILTGQWSRDPGALRDFLRFALLR